MKALPLLFLMAMLALPAFARADQPAYPFRVIPKADCVATLQIAFAPEFTIQNGLTALDQLNLEKVSALSCLNEALANWEQEYPAVMVRAPDLLPAFGQHIADLQVQVQCFNPWPQGSKLYDVFESSPPQGCAGKVINAEEKPKLQAEYKKWTGISRLLSRVPDVFLLSYSDISAKWRAERDRLTYCRPATPGASSAGLKIYQENLLKYCDGKAMGEEEVAGQAALVAQLENEYHAKYKTVAEQSQKLNELFGYSYIPDVLNDKLAELLPLAQKFVCTKRTDDGAWWESAMKEPCEGNFSATEELAKNRDALLAYLGDLDSLRVKARQEREARTLQHEAREAKLNEPRLQSYEGQRILLQYQAYLKRGGNPNALDSFCGGYEAQLQRDKQLAELNFGIYEKTKPVKIEGETNRKYAGDYGLTEGELGALNSYIGSFYRVVNPALYDKKKPSPEIALYRDTLNSGLQKLPDYTGTVTRFAALPKEVLDQHKVGSVVTYDSFTSASKAKNWKWEGNTKFLIYSKHKGKDVSETNSAEQEVLFEAGTKFKVLEKSKVGAITKIVLSEVEEKEEPKKGGKKK